MKEIRSKKTNKVQIITDSDWEWLKKTGRAANFTMNEIKEISLKQPKIVEPKQTAEPKQTIKPKTKKKND